jgi:type IV secretory pathway TrbD component
MDVLAPDNVGPRANLTTTPPGRTVEVPGGTQALHRVEEVEVVLAGGSRGLVPRPDLLGAIVIKAGATWPTWRGE